MLKEEIGTRTWPDRATARAEVFTFIETFYNRRRLRKHKTFGYLTPAETRQRHQHALGITITSPRSRGNFSAPAPPSNVSHSPEGRTRRGPRDNRRYPHPAQPPAPTGRAWSTSGVIVHYVIE
ncbi:hypothetical protein AB0911_38565 [Streptomyces nigra]|uniref:hypothetical protein n=1 Tax=Streptomyces nigra TaxID=1827580 RepID=UPI00345721EA